MPEKYNPNQSKPTPNMQTLIDSIGEMTNIELQNELNGWEEKYQVPQSFYFQLFFYINALLAASNQNQRVKVKNDFIRELSGISFDNKVFLTTVLSRLPNERLELLLSILVQFLDNISTKSDGFISPFDNISTESDGFVSPDSSSSFKMNRLPRVVRCLGIIRGNFNDFTKAAELYPLLEKTLSPVIYNLYPDFFNPTLQITDDGDNFEPFRNKTSEEIAIFIGNKMLTDRETIILKLRNFLLGYSNEELTRLEDLLVRDPRFKDYQ